jgi:hypothetical protein
MEPNLTGFCAVLGVSIAVVTVLCFVLLCRPEVQTRNMRAIALTAVMLGVSVGGLLGLILDFVLYLPSKRML